MKPISEIPVLRQYDKLIAVIVLIGLVVSLFYLTSAGMNRRRDEDKWIEKLKNLAPSGQPLTPAPMADYNDAANLAQQAPQLALPVSNKAGFLTPELRVKCIEEGCKKPIPWDALECPFCGSKQPPPDGQDPESDKDGDGMPDMYEDKYGFNKNVAADAALDMDGDGFTNLEEYLAGTDPTDPKSHPPLVNKLRVKSIESVKLPFIFTALNTMPDGKQMVFNTAKPKQTYWIKAGEPIGETGWIAVSSEEKSVKRMNEAKGYVQTIDISTVVVRRKSDNKEVTLRINEGSKDTDVEATIVLPLDNTEITAVEGGTIKVREETYRVIAVDKEAGSVTVENQSSGKQKVITKLD